MLNIFRGTSRLLSSQLKLYPVRQASNLFEPDYLAVSFVYEFFFHISTENQSCNAISFQFLGFKTQTPSVSMCRFQSNWLWLCCIGIVSEIFASNCWFIKFGSFGMVKLLMHIWLISMYYCNKKFSSYCIVVAGLCQESIYM